MIHFTKMHGLGNDYIYVNCLQKTIPDPEGFARFISDRHFGCGSDGLILILPSDKADFKMRIFNADGSEGQMCGNGARCIAKYVYDYGLTVKTTITLETLGGIQVLEMKIGADQKVSLVRVNMGKAILSPSQIPLQADGNDFIHQPVDVGGQIMHLTCVSMGNPHAVTFVDNLDNLDLKKMGPLYEHHPLFPARVNAEFVSILDSHTIQMRVWERGSGETLACGTGACAAVVACVLRSICPREEDITVRLLGGELAISYQHDDTVFMTGPATTIFDGIINY